MTHEPGNPEIEKEMASLTDQLSKASSAPRPIGRMEQKEARAILGYITYLEEMAAETIRTSKKDTVKKDYDKQTLDAGLIKLVGIAAGMHSHS